MINEIINWYVNDLRTFDQFIFAAALIPAPLVFIPVIGSIFSKGLANKLSIDNLPIALLLIACSIMPFFNIFIAVILLDMLGMSIIRFVKNTINLISPSHLKMR